MTTKKSLKKRIRQRMKRTGESYMAARRILLERRRRIMTHLSANSTIETLQLTLKTTRLLQAMGVRYVHELVDWVNAPDAARRFPMNFLEAREVLAARGF